MAAAAALCAVAILALAVALRACAPDPSPEPAGGAAPAEGIQAGGGCGDAAEDGAFETVFDEVKDLSWVSEGGAGSILQLTDSMLVERAADNTLSALSFASCVEEAGEGQAMLSLEADDGSEATVIVGLDGEGRPASLVSDSFAFSHEYVVDPRGPSGGEGLSVEGVPQEYLALVGEDEDALVAAISAYALARHPSASTASFDGEVYLDMVEDEVHASFHLDDPSSSVITVSWDGSSFGVIG